MQPLLPLLNDAAAKWFPFVYHVTWQASLLAVLLLVVVRLGRRWPSPMRYALLVLALVKFALPPQLSMPTGLFSQMGPAGTYGEPRMGVSQSELDGFAHAVDRSPRGTDSYRFRRRHWQRLR